MKPRLIRFTIAFVFFVAALCASALAQSDAPTQVAQPEQAWYLILYNAISGVGISFLVALLKKTVAIRYPKVTAFIASILATLVPILAGAPFAANGLWPVVTSVLTQLATAIGTHEAGIKQIGKVT